MVFPGRSIDVPVIGPASSSSEWARDDLDALAGGTPSATSSNAARRRPAATSPGFAAFADLTEPGFPIAEIADDGSSVITKNPGTGGAVTNGTVTAQLLYEIGEPAYLNPDVIAHLDTADAVDLGDDHVEIHGVRGSPPPAPTKVAIPGIGGWENSVVFTLTGTDLDAKATLVERSVRRYTESVDGIDAVATRPNRSGRSTIPTPRMRPPSCSGSRCGARNTPPGGRSRRGWSSWRCRATRGCTPSARRNRGRHSASTGRHCSTSRCSSTRSTTTTAPRRSLSPPRHPSPRVRRRRPPNHCWRRRRRHPAATSWSSSRSVSSCMPARATRAGREPGCLGARPGRMGLAHVDSHRRGAPAPPSRNPSPGDLALRVAQPRRGQLRHPRTARNRRHIDPAPGRTSKGARRMAALTQHRAAAIPREDVARQTNPETCPPDHPPQRGPSPTRWPCWPRASTGGAPSRSRCCGWRCCST